jgi:hypothetical protein
MPTDKLRHLKEAKSASVRLCKSDPKIARLDFILSDGQFLTVVIPRFVLKRFVGQAQKLLPKAPFPADGRSKDPSATSRNK